MSSLTTSTPAGLPISMPKLSVVLRKVSTPPVDLRVELPLRLISSPSSKIAPPLTLTVSLNSISEAPRMVRLPPMMVSLREKTTAPSVSITSGPWSTTSWSKKTDFGKPVGVTVLAAMVKLSSGSKLPIAELNRTTPVAWMVRWSGTWGASESPFK